MILQALSGYYDRKVADLDPAQRLAPFGFEDKEIPFIIELNQDGGFVGFTDTRTVDGKKRIAVRFLVPLSVKKTSAVSANLLWENVEYIFGIPDPKKLDVSRKKKKEAEYLSRLGEMRADFMQRIQSLCAETKTDEGVNAVRLFMESDAVVANDPLWAEICETNAVLAFRLRTETDLVCQRPGVVSAASKLAEGLSTDEGESSVKALCLVTGRPSTIERLHSPIKGVWDAQTSGANIVSINNKNAGDNNGGQTPAFASYGKQQGYNSPVGRMAAFAYTTALNHLLRKGSRQRLQIGDASTVFWSQERDDIEDSFASIFGNQNDPDQTEELRTALESVRSGKFDGARGDRLFYVLGLAPNAARISVRFWQAEPLREIAHRIREWFDDLEIDRGNNEPQHLNVKRLLSAVCLATKDRPYGDIERLPPSLGGDVARAIFSAGELPMPLLTLAIQRCRAEQAKKDDKTGKPVRNVSYPRAALIKACLNRHARIHKQSSKEITVSLDKSNADKPYVLGRLFATFERMQEESVDRELNRSIRDSFFGAAMATPRSVFPRLVRLNQTHIRDIKRSRIGTAVFFDKLLQEINDKLDSKTGFPGSLDLRAQGVFTIGYYHQRQAFFTKSE